MQNDAQHWRMMVTGSQEVHTTPEQLMDAAMEYFKWCDENPIKTKRTPTSGKTQGTKVEVEHVRPYTIQGLCLHCGINNRWIDDIKQTHAKDSKWFRTLEKILTVIYTQNLEGAIVDIYNPIIVSKILNLDKGNGDQDNQVVKVEIVDSRKDTIPISENEILKNLDYGKVEILKDKSGNFERQTGEEKDNDNEK